MKYSTYLIAFLCTLLYGCSPKGSTSAKEPEVHSRTPVTVTEVTEAPISESVELNATSSFIRKNQVRSTAIGYIHRMLVQLGDPVRKGQVLFILKTKEATALGNNLFPNDSSLRFTGLIQIKASQDGFVTALHHQLGDFVQEGDSLCSIVDQNSLVFMINVPFEYSRYVRIGLNCEIKLPDGRVVEGQIFQKVSIMDIGSQTQSYMARVPSTQQIPENLIAKVRIFKQQSKTSLTLPKSAVLTNEEQSQFWVMKMVNDTLAVRVPIQKGLENAERVELLGPSLKLGDRVVSTGNYGLVDSSAVYLQPTKP